MHSEPSRSRSSSGADGFKRPSRRILWAALAALFGGASACGGTPTPPVGTGGTGSGGGPAASGGAGSGGAPASGGVVGSGGAPSSGGAPATGGASTTGGSGGQAATGGGSTGGGSGLTLVEPIERSDSSFVLEFGDYLFEVDPTQGARVVTFSLAGTNLLRPVMLTGDPMWLTGGATFWLSPQVAWNWPPVPEIDQEPYEAMVVGSTIEVVGASATVDSSPVHVEKSFAADLTGEGVIIVYEIHNEATTPVSYAPWEISRHARGGMTFWPGARAPDAAAEWEFEPTLVEGVYYWDDSVSAASDVKISADGEGWVAHVEGDLLFVKSWTPVPAEDIALLQGEVELYLGDGFVEVEVQGPYGEIAAAAASSFEITWYVRALPEGTDVSVGSADLLAAVDAVLP